MKYYQQSICSPFQIAVEVIVIKRLRSEIDELKNLLVKLFYDL